MTDQTLQAYLEKRKNMHQSLVEDCTSVPELLLKIELHGKKWTKWDWAFLMCNAFKHKLLN